MMSRCGEDLVGASQELRVEVKWNRARLKLSWEQGIRADLAPCEIEGP